MRDPVRDWLASVLTGPVVSGSDVVEVGALDVNGSIRGHVENLGPASYLATDARPGKGVDFVVAAEQLGRRHITGDVVISAEMLEHAENWRAALAGMVRAVRPGGLLVMTTVSYGFPYHPFPDDYWRFPPAMLAGCLTGAGLRITRADTDPAYGVMLAAAKPAGWRWPPGTQARWRAAAHEVTPATG